MLIRIAQLHGRWVFCTDLLRTPGLFHAAASRRCRQLACAAHPPCVRRSRHVSCTRAPQSTSACSCMALHGERQESRLTLLQSSLLQVRHGTMPSAACTCKGCSCAQHHFVTCTLAQSAYLCSVSRRVHPAFEDPMGEGACVRTSTAAVLRSIGSNVRRCHLWASGQMLRTTLSSWMWPDGQQQGSLVALSQGNGARRQTHPAELGACCPAVFAYSGVTALGLLSRMSEGTTSKVMGLDTGASLHLRARQQTLLSTRAHPWLLDWDGMHSHPTLNSYMRKPSELNAAASRSKTISALLPVVMVHS